MRFRFGDFLLDDVSFRLMRDGCAVALRRKVFDLLVVLVRERERVLSREELVARLWSTTTVGAGSLSGLVNELRAALGEGGYGPSSIRTVHARGYQFAAPVEVEREPSDDGAPREPSNVIQAVASGAGRAARDRFVRARVELVRSGARAVCAALPEPARRARWLAGAMAEASEVGFQARWQIVPDDPTGSRVDERIVPAFNAPPVIGAAHVLASPAATRAPIALGLDVREPEAWSRAGGLPRLLDLLGRAPVFVIAALAAPADDAGMREWLESDARIERAPAAELAEEARGGQGSGASDPPSRWTLTGILRDLAQFDAAEFEAALRALGFECARPGPIRVPRRVAPRPRRAEGRRGSEGL